MTTEINQKENLEGKIILTTWRLWFDQMSRKERDKTNDYLINLQLEYKANYGTYLDCRQEHCSYYRRQKAKKRNI